MTGIETVSIGVVLVGVGVLVGYLARDRLRRREREEGASAEEDWVAANRRRALENSMYRATSRIDSLSFELYGLRREVAKHLKIG